jgi:hypothetical protein
MLANIERMDVRRAKQQFLTIGASILACLTAKRL